MGILRRSTALLVVLLLAGSTTAASGQHISEAALKAAYLVNFAKFTEWPDRAPSNGSTFTFCVAGDPLVARALLTAITAHPSKEPLGVLPVKPDGDLRACQMLYAAGHDLKQVVRMLDAVKGAPVFTVGDADGFAELGGVAQLRLENGRMRFAINMSAAQRARLQLSAKLLSLALLVKEDSNAAR